VLIPKEAVNASDVQALKSPRIGIATATCRSEEFSILTHGLILPNVSRHQTCTSCDSRYRSRDPLVLLQSGVHQGYTERSGPTTPSSSTRKTGARGGSRTHMRKNPRRILSPQRLPFRHPGKADTKSSMYGPRAQRLAEQHQAHPR
jgi:hypothetical protein